MKILRDFFLAIFPQLDAQGYFSCSNVTNHYGMPAEKVQGKIGTGRQGEESVTDQSPHCNVTARVKFSDIPIAPLQGANVSGGMSTGGGAQKPRSAPGYSM